ncbi:response regulator transcription factor [Burkholderia lata]|uniref:response regulator transcription factor n=1 Tax=Burkholderia lata (strain ATCC 17760 / DSM 23089 / LMG 22485 / NCIMB 9086 / R18194 / 383) TaxID=482957 RepID=UPI0039998CF8
MYEIEHLCATQIVSIVDDDEAFRLATGSLVRSFGRQTRLFASAEEFLNSGKLAETSCLISDVMMPGMSGVEMLLQILALDHVIPTIFITSFPTAALKAKALDAGALMVLGKPIDPDALEHWLNVALNQP